MVADGVAVGDRAASSPRTTAVAAGLVQSPGNQGEADHGDRDVDPHDEGGRLRDHQRGELER